MAIEYKPFNFDKNNNNKMLRLTEIKLTNSLEREQVRHFGFDCL